MGAGARPDVASRGRPVKRILAGLALFVVIFCFAALWFFPIDAMVEGQIRSFERQTGLAVEWSQASWSLWGTTLSQVVVRDPLGRTLLELSSLELSPRWAAVEATGHAAWGTLKATLRSTGVDADFPSYPLPALPNLPLDKGHVSGRLQFRPVGQILTGEFKITGDLDVLMYRGPLTLDATVRLEGKKGIVAVDVSGDRLRGRADQITVDLAEGLAGAVVSGPIRVELKGTTYFLKISGHGRDIKAQLAL
jgi:hypothetical protein